MVVLAAVLLAAWLFAFRGTLASAYAIFAADAYRTNLYLLIAAVALVVVRARREPPKLARTPQHNPAAFAIAAAGLITNALLLRADLRVPAIAAFGAATYGLAGLFLDRAAWKRGLAAAMMLVLALPFGDQASTYLGFSARVATAKLVAAALTALGTPAISSSSVLAMESGVAYVDIPCSGLKSLWTGAVFFLGATYVERARIDRGWFAKAIAFAVAILAANVARVFVIVLLASVLHAPRAADLVHEALGVLGFAIACVFGAFLLRRGDKQIIEQSTPSRPAIVAAAVLTACALLCGLFATRPVAIETNAPPLAIDLPFETRPLALTEAESGLLGRVGGSAANKLSFRTADLSGTALILVTERWRAHHPPEICLASAGVKIGAIRDLELGAPNRRARLISLDGGARTALYFYASEGVTTGDIMERVFADVLHGDRRWVMVSILIDRPVDASDPALIALYEDFRRGVKT